MSQKDKTIVVIAGLAIVSVAGFVILGGGGGKHSRSSALSAVRSTMGTDDLIRERASIVTVLNYSHDDPAAKAENVDKLKKNLSNIENQLIEQGVDLSTLEPKAEWES